MRIAVTGSRGYLGRALVRALAREGSDEVVAIDSRPPLGERAVGLREVRRDVRDPDLAHDLADADAVVHLAFRVLGRGADARSVNVDGSRNVFGQAIRAGVGTIVHASSAAAYGCSPENPVPLTEGHPLRAVPAFYYTETKVAVERMLDEIEGREPGVRVVRMRPVGTLGPGAPAMPSRRLFVSASDFDPLMQFTWVDDVVVAFIAALRTPAAAGPYNVGAPAPVRASRVAPLIGVRALRLPYRVLRAAAGAAAALRLPRSLHAAWVDMARYPIVVDTAKAERDLRWRASGDCESVLRRYGELIRPRTGARTRVAAESAR